MFSTGIGYHTAKFLARKGAKVYLGARSESKASEAIYQLEQEGLGHGQVIWLKFDLSDPRLAKESAEHFLKRESGYAFSFNILNCITYSQ